MSRAQMKNLLAWLLTIFAYLAVQIAWQLMERIAYGQVTPRLVDTVIGCLIVYLIRCYMTNIVSKLEVKYIVSLAKDLKSVIEKEKANKI